MDSVTQLALGAAAGYAVLGKRVGRPALAWGAALGTLPDLDVLAPMGDAVDDFTRHRSWSHSLFVTLAITPALAFLGSRLHAARGAPMRSWLGMVLLVLWTHVLLDSFTVYGTQIFWPLPWAPECWSTIFIIDPLYTLPLLIGIVAAALGRARPNRWGLILSSAYLAWTLLAKAWVGSVVTAQLQRQGLPQDRVLTTPSPFNTLLWRVVVVTDTTYYEGYHSLIAPGEGLRLRPYPNQRQLLRGLEQHGPVRRLHWFTKGILAVGPGQDDPAEVVLSDLRMGLEPSYVFRFAVGRHEEGKSTPMPPRKLPSEFDPSSLGLILGRIFDPSVELGPR